MFAHLFLILLFIFRVSIANADGSKPSYFSQNLYDQAYLINLDSSTDRLRQVTTELNNAGIEFIRWPAINQLNILIRDVVSNEISSGREIKENRFKIYISENEKLIICDPNKINGTEYNFKAIQEDHVPGQLAIWCSNINIWKDAKEKNYKNIIIFEDDIKFKQANSIKNKINQFIKELPITFDVAFYYVERKRGFLIPIADKNCVQKSSSDFLGWRSWVVIYSAKGINKLLNTSKYNHNLDVYITSNKILSKIYNDQELEVYYSCYNDDIFTRDISDIGYY